MYHYHLNREFPFSVGCFRGSVDYYAALGSVDMRETLLPIYSPYYAATKLRNARAEINGAVGSTGNTSVKVGAVDDLLSRAADLVDEVAAAKRNGL